MFERINFFFKIHFKKHIMLYGIVIFVFLIGITSGAFTVNGISASQRGGLADYFNSLIDNISYETNKSIDKTSILLEGLRQYGGFAFMVWFFGLSYIGIPFIITAFGFKGFLLGFTTGFLVSFYGIRGLLLIIACILPQNLIYIPCMTIITIIGTENAVQTYKRRKAPVSKQYREKNFTAYTIKIFIVTIILLAGILYEAFIAPFFLDIISNVF